MSPLIKISPTGETADLAVGHRLADRAELHGIGRHRRRQPAILRLAVDLVHVEAERQVPADQFGRDRRGTGEQPAAAVQPNHAADVLQHQLVSHLELQSLQRRRLASRQPCIRDGHAGRDGAPVGPLLERRSVLQRDHDAGVELLPDARHRAEQGGLHLADIVGNRLGALGEVGADAGRHRVVAAGDAFGDMAERQKGQPLIALVPGERQLRVHAVLHRIDDVAMAVHGTLGRPRRARRVDQDGEVVGRARGDQLLEQRVLALAVVASGGHELVERDDHRVAEGAQALHVEHDDLAQGRAALAHVERLVELLVVLDEQHRGLRIVDQVFELLGGVGGIDAGGDATGTQDAEVGVVPFRHGVGQHRGHVAGTETGLVQGEGDCARTLKPLVPRDGVPDAVELLAHRRPVAPRPAGQQEALGQGLRNRQRRLGGHGFLVPVSASSSSSSNDVRRGRLLPWRRDRIPGCPCCPSAARRYRP